MAIETKVIVEISCDYPGCKEIMTMPSHDYKTFKGWNHSILVCSLKESMWSIEHGTGREVVLCKIHSSVDKFIKEYIVK